jgi:hypothetical protein
MPAESRLRARLPTPQTRYLLPWQSPIDVLITFYHFLSTVANPLVSDLRISS